LLCRDNAVSEILLTVLPNDEAVSGSFEKLRLIQAIAG